MHPLEKVPRKVLVSVEGTKQYKIIILKDLFIGEM
jgi:hypothetical protein